MHNSALTDPLIIVKSFSCIMQAWKERFDGKLATMVFIINLQHTKNAWRQQHTLKVQTTSIATAMGAMAIGFQLSNQCLQVIAQSLAAILPSLLALNRHCTIYGGMLPQLQAPLGFHNLYQPTIITKATTYIMNSSLIGSHQRLIRLALCTIYIYFNKELKYLPWILIMFSKCTLQDIIIQNISPTCHLCTSHVNDTCLHLCVMLH